MKNAKKMLSLLLALIMVFSLMTTAFAAEPKEDLTGSIVILHTNDVHGAIDGYATIAAVKQQLESQGAYVLLLDAGDFIQGETSVSVSQGKTAVELMNAAGYDAVAPGNHEFDYGYDNLATLAKEAKFPILAANITKDGKLAFGDNTVFTAPDGTKIGVFGLSTPETASKAHPAKIQGVSFASGKDMYQIAQAQVDALKAQGCDIIVCLGHLGIDDETAVTKNRSIDLLENVTGIDLFIDGHSHSDLDDIKAATNGTCKVGNTVLTSTGTKFANIGIVTIANGTMEAGTMALADVTVEPNADIAARAAAIKAEIAADFGTVFATTEVKLDGNRDPGVRTMETNLGDLIADAILWQATKDGALDVPKENVVAITNGGGIRATIEAGDITKNDINTVLPFGNTVAFVYVSGETLLEVLEASTFCTPKAVGAFPQVAGIEFTVNTNAPYNKGEQYGDTTYFAPKSINRVTITSINGKAFDPKATYAIVTNDFLAAGGDTYYALSVAENIVDTGVPMDQAVMAYITEVLNGKVTADKYGESAGRITVLNTPDASQVVVSPQTVTYNGKEVEMEVYNIDGYNYFKLRDVAALVNDSSNRFEVGFIGETFTVNCTTGKSYTAVGNEMAVGTDKSATCVASRWTMIVDGNIVDCDIYNIGDNNFFKLRDLGGALGFGVEYDEATNTAMITTK